MPAANQSRKCGATVKAHPQAMRRQPSRRWALYFARFVGHALDAGSPGSSQFQSKLAAAPLGSGSEKTQRRGIGARSLAFARPGDIQDLNLLGLEPIQQ